ncbi:MAG: CDP-alcohol phosphatidyltransferase family protein [Synergistaceae bacterium]|nr:CDP-alcohol phosphatidyltransferase family protein [Synergistaceae bacterium]
MKEKIIGFYNLANTITCFGLCLSLMACVLAFGGAMSLAMTLFIVAGLCDLFDGVIARKIKRTDIEKTYGIQLDSLADCISFGVVPCIISYAYGFNAWWSLLFYGVYIIHAVVRLAYFNVVTAEKTQHYLGVPVTYIALLLPIFMLFNNQIANAVLFAIMGELFVIKIKIPKPRGVWYALFPLIALGLIIAWWIV